VQIVFSGMHFVGPDSETALRTALAAASQGRFWNVLELLYENQGTENTGWVTDPLLRSIGDAVPGLSTSRMLDARQSPAVERLLAQGDALAQQAGVNSTPTFAVGRTGSGSLRIVRISSLGATGLEPAIDAALKE
jgi:protein-disulfide isomerase